MANGLKAQALRLFALDERWRLRDMKTNKNLFASSSPPKNAPMAREMFLICHVVSFFGHFVWQQSQGRSGSGQKGITFTFTSL